MTPAIRYYRNDTHLNARDDAMTISFIHHYTTIETLALILESRNIRFNRLDRVDDMREAPCVQGLEFGKYFFVSCWTHDDTESIPQWSMYAGNMQGVRISLPAMPFAQKEMKPLPGWIMQQSSKVYAPLSLGEMYGDTYFVNPMCMDEKYFSGPVDYVPNVEEYYREAVSVRINNDGTKEIEIKNHNRLVCLKSLDWKFQSEYRFFLFVLPSIPVPPTGPGDPDFASRQFDCIYESLLGGLAPGVEYLDFTLADSAIDQLIVTTGPLCSSDSKICAEALVKRYAPNGIVRESCLSGTIRQPQR